VAPKTKIILVIILLLVIWQRRITVTYPEVIPLPPPPEQTAVDSEVKPWEKSGFHFRPLAHFAIKALVLGAERYRFDGAAKIAPVDLALGWGVMAQKETLEDIWVSQTGRWFFLRWKKEMPLDETTIMRHASNMHVIPADKTVQRELLKLRGGDVIQMIGYLVEVNRPDGFVWRSSTSREDRGNGACEIVWANSLRRLSPHDRTLASPSQ